MLQEFFVTVTKKIPEPLDIKTAKEIIKAAIKGGAELLLTEDLPCVKMIHGIKIENPFS